MTENQLSTSAWQEGFKAGLIGLPPDNPYPKDSEAARQYASGFVDGRGIKGKQITHGSTVSKGDTSANGSG